MSCATPSTPKSARLEAGFSTPLSFNQHLAMEQIRSSPLRRDLLREKLLGESSVGHSASRGANGDNNHANSADAEFENFHSEYEQRNVERDVLLADVKIHQDKARQFLSRVTVTSDDVPIQQQLALLRQLHAEEMQEKNLLMNRMTAMIQDLEQQNERLRSLRRGRGGEASPTQTPSSAVGVSNLLKQVSRLQSEKALLNAEIVQLKGKLAECSYTEYQSLRNLNSTLENDKVAERSETERRTKGLEMQVEKLQNDVRTESQKNVVERESIKFEEMVMTSDSNNDMLHQQISILEQKNNELRLKLVCAEAKLPEVVTKVRHLGELNLSNPEEVLRIRSQLSRVGEELSTCKQQLSSESRRCADALAAAEHWQAACKLNESRLQESQLQVAQLEARVAELETTAVSKYKQVLEQLSGSIIPAVRSLALQQRQTRAAVIQLQTATAAEVCNLYTKIGSSLQVVESHCDELKARYRRELELRKQYHNELMELRGNIRVLCRVRPVIREDGSDARVIVAVDKEDDTIVKVERDGRLLSFDCDRVFHPEATQDEVFAEVQKLVTSCADGYNVCIFAYGQTGSGKTYTMEGCSSHPGITAKTMTSLFSEINQRMPDWQYTVQVSAMEIYNETIRDLLSGAEESLDIKMSAEGGLVVPGLKWETISCVEDMKKVFAASRNNRATAATAMNERSSRSHSVFCATVVGTSSNNTRVIGKLNLVDLAGSERVCKSGAEGDRLREAQHINKSLSALGDVIHSLQTHQSHVPYRNSKLTYLLQDCLGGESKTLMVMQVSPVQKNAAETVATLAFAQRVRSVELGQAKKRTLTADGTPARGQQTPKLMRRK